MGSAKAPEAAYYVWTPGGAPPRPPRPLWPRVLGVVVAIAAQGTLYLTLRQLAVAHRPAWADHLHHGASTRPVIGAWPEWVTVDLTKVTTLPRAARDEIPAAETLPPPVLAPPPVIDLPPPALNTRR